MLLLQPNFESKMFVGLNNSI